MLDRIKAAMQGEVQQQSGLLKSVDEAVTLTWRQVRVLAHTARDSCVLPELAPPT